MAFEEIRDYFARHVLGRLRVRSAPLLIRVPRVRRVRHPVEVHPLRAQARVQSLAILSFHGSLECSSGGFRVARVLAAVKGERIRSYVPGEIGTRPVPLLMKAETRSDLRRALALPQERVNRLRWRPSGSRPGEVVLAWYGPIVRDAVVKLTMNHRRGTLLVWYNPKSKPSAVRDVCLCRRMGIGEKPEWRWI